MRASMYFGSMVILMGTMAMAPVWAADRAAAGGVVHEGTIS